MSQVVTIFSAVHLEARAIAGVIEAPVPTPVLPVHSTFENLKVIHHLIGLRAEGLAKVKVDPDTRCILLAGVAGALDPRLAVGDLVLCDCPDDLASRLEMQRGLIHTSVDVASTGAQKADLFSTTGAAMVDMETAIVRKYAAERDMPFICLRAISDLARQSLDPHLVRLIDQWGRARVGEVAAFVLGNPLRFFSLMKVGRDAGRAASRLGAGVVTILRAINTRR